MSNNKDFKVKNSIQPTVYQEALGTVVSGSEGYDIAGASYDSKSFTPSPTINSIGVAFKPDGTKMYTLDLSGDDVAQYSLTSAWDVSTATSDSKTFDVGSQDTDPYEVEFKSDGTKMYILGTANDALYQYTLSTAWDVSTSSYDSVSFSFTSQTNQPYGMCFNTDGTKLYVADYQNKQILQYNLSTAWDASTISYASKVLSVSTELGSAQLYSVSISSNGTKLYVGTHNQGMIYEYILSTAYDVSTGSYTNNSFSSIGQEASVTSIVFKPDGTKMFVTGFNSDSIYQYSTVLNTAELDLSTGSVFDYTPTSDVQVTLTNPAASGTSSGATLLLNGGGTTGYDLGNASYSGVSFSVASEDTVPLGLSFNDTGTKLYVAGAANDSIFQYSLSAAYSISTASYDSVSFSVSGQAAAVQAVSFKSDGTKMYVLEDNPNNGVHQYSLSTAFDISTASYDSVSFSVASQEGGPLGLFIKPDGTKFYVCGTGSDTVFQYSMSTAWDMSTASYDSVSFSVASQDSRPNGIFFNPTGDKMFISGQGSDTILEYALSTSWNVSTASYTGTSLDVSTEELNPQDLVMSSDGKALFVITSETPTIYQYNSATPATITYDTSLQWSGGTAPTSPAIGETDVITFNTTDGGTTYKSALAIDGAK